MKKESVISFKADQQLSELLQDMPNRSDFIRKAILEALDSTCPLCNGTGILSPSQKAHWNEFAEHHHIGKCEEGCGESILFCDFQHEHKK